MLCNILFTWWTAKNGGQSNQAITHRLKRVLLGLLKDPQTPQATTQLGQSGYVSTGSPHLCCKPKPFAAAWGRPPWSFPVRAKCSGQKKARVLNHILFVQPIGNFVPWISLSPHRSPPPTAHQPVHGHSRSVKPSKLTLPATQSAHHGKQWPTRIHKTPASPRNPVNPK